MSHYLVEPLYYYSVQAPTMKSNTAPLPQHNVAHNVDYRATVQHCMGGGGAKFRKSFKSLQINFQDCGIDYYIRKLK